MSRPITVYAKFVVEVDDDMSDEQFHKSFPEFVGEQVLEEDPPLQAGLFCIRAMTLYHDPEHVVEDAQMDEVDEPNTPDPVEPPVVGTDSEGGDPD